MDEAVAGASAGISGTILGFPLDTIKARMQISNLGITKSIQEIYLQEKVRGFYRGVAAPLLSLTVLNTLNFSAYRFYCKILYLKGPASSELSSGAIVWKYGLAGALVGPLASSISTPFELIKTKMQLGKRSGQQISNSFQMAGSILRSNGMTGLYQGHLVNTTREMLFLSTYFFVYENFKNQVTLVVQSPSLSIPVAGGFAGALGWFVSFPLDNIKSNIQALVLPNVFQRKSALSIGRELFNSRGFVGLYSGVLPSVLRAFIVSATRFSSYEYTLSLFRS